MRNRFPTHALSALVMLLALTLLLIGYYWVHKPFSGPELLTALGYALDVAVPFALIALAGAAGRAALGRAAPRLALPLDSLNRAERLALDVALGLPVLSALGLLLGLTGLYRPAAIALALLALTVVVRRALWAWLRDARALVRIAPAGDRTTSFMIGFTLLMLALALIHSLTPVYAWDALVYHVVEPSRDLLAGRMTASADNFYLGFPKAVDMLFGLAMGITGRDTSTAPVHFFIGVVALAGVAGAARRLAGVQAAWLAVALLLASFNVWQLFGWQYVDLAQVLYAAVVFIVLLRWESARLLGWVVVLGVLCGAAFSVKYTAGALILAVALVLLVRAPRAAPRNLLVFGLAAGLAYLPWALRGLLLYGNPIYPYLFGGLNWDSGRMTAFSQAGRGLLAQGRAPELLTLPFSATILGFDYGDAYAFTLGPFLLTAPFMLPFVWRRLAHEQRQAVWVGALLLAVLYVYWAITAATTGIGMQTRLVIALLPLSAVLGALAITALERMPARPVRVGFIVRAAILLTMITSAAEALSYMTAQRVFSVVTGETSREDFLFYNIVTYAATMQGLSELPAGSQVRILYDTRSYYCPPQIICLPDALFDQWSRRRAAGMTPEEVLADWRAAGDDYLLYFRLGQGAILPYSYRPEYDRQVESALQAGLTEVWTSEDSRYTLFTWPAGE